MKKLYQRSLFIFRRDLRLVDNTGLMHAQSVSKEIVPCFFFDPQQVGPENAYRSMNSMQFMLNSLKELDHEIHKQKGELYFLHGDPSSCLKKMVQSGGIDAVFCNYDYTPFSLKRDEALLHVCNQYHIPFIQVHDALLTEPEKIVSKTNTPYAIFTPFFKRAHQEVVAYPNTQKTYTFFAGLSGEMFCQAKKFFIQLLSGYENKKIWVYGGRSEAIALTKKLDTLAAYHTTRDVPSLQTSNFSAHLKFGTLSVRELFWSISNTLGPYHDLIRQLYWRDFFTHVAYHSPFVFGSCFQQKYNNLSWVSGKQEERYFQRWCDGQTGVPIVDAGMRQLNETGFMHNRVRMIVASFLIKDLHVDWRKGERYFAQKLVDYDPAVNNGNWQWSASTGCDAQPYFRIFNPWLQQKKYDPDALYIKTWVPELKHISPKQIHTLFNQKIAPLGYPSGIVDHNQERLVALAQYKACR